MVDRSEACTCGGRDCGRLASWRVEVPSRNGMTVRYSCPMCLWGVMNREPGSFNVVSIMPQKGVDRPEDRPSFGNQTPEMVVQLDGSASLVVPDAAAPALPDWSDNRRPGRPKGSKNKKKRGKRANSPPKPIDVVEE